MKKSYSLIVHILLCVGVAVYSKGTFAINKINKEATKMSTHTVIKDSPHLSAMHLAATKAGAFILEGFVRINSLPFSEKSSNPNDILTQYDRRSQDIITEVLQKSFPSYGVIGEESSHELSETWNKGYVWVVDPIDGTLNFRYGRKEFVISIALLKDGESVCGLIYAPARNEFFYAEKDKGAFLNGKRIFVRDQPVTKTPIIHFELNKIKDPSIFSEISPMASSIVQHGGSAALDMAFVASGQIDAQFSTFLSIWDIAAGVIIVSEAGGITVNTSGTGDVLRIKENSCSFLCGHKNTIDAVTKKIPASLANITSSHDAN